MHQPIDTKELTETEQDAQRVLSELNLGIVDREDAIRIINKIVCETHSDIAMYYLKLAWRFREFWR